MSKKLNITPGEVKQADSGLWVNDDSGFCLADFGWDEPMSDKQRNHAVANATLYADAHNTYNKCQMLPSELLERAIMRDKYLTGYEEALRYANTRAVSIDQIVEVVKEWVTANDDTSTEEACEHVIADLRKRLEALADTM